MLAQVATSAEQSKGLIEQVMPALLVMLGAFLSFIATYVVDSRRSKRESKAAQRVTIEDFQAALVVMVRDLSEYISQVKQADQAGMKGVPLDAITQEGVSLLAVSTSEVAIRQHRLVDREARKLSHDYLDTIRKAIDTDATADALDEMRRGADIGALLVGRLGVLVRATYEDEPGILTRLRKPRSKGKH